jgi:type I restriction enzyme S subunit
MTTTNGWPSVPLADVLAKNENVIQLSPTTEYREVTVRLWGNGVVLRRVATGAEIAGNRRFHVSTGQFILSRIDARNGAMGIVPPELDGAVVSNDFPTFNAVRSRLLPEFLGWLSKTRTFVEACRAASEGTTNRVRLQEEKFVRLTIPLPPLAEQRRIVARIDRLAVKIDEAQTLKQRSLEHVRSLYLSARAEFFRRHYSGPWTQLGEVFDRDITKSCG